jgi:hypothetical protein
MPSGLEKVIWVAVPDDEFCRLIFRLSPGEPYD